MLAVLGMSLVYLLATLFDHRFALSLPGIVVLGLVAGFAARQWLEKYPERLARKLPWFALTGLSAAITTCLFFVASAVPFGSTGVFLLATALAVFTYASWTIGQNAWFHEHGTPRPWLMAAVTGALAGILASFSLAEHFHGPLFTAWLASAGLVILSLMPRPHVVRLAVAGLSALFLLAAGIFSAWDFTALPRWSYDDASIDKPLYAHDASENFPKRIITRWDDLARTDIVVDKKISRLTPVFQNGALAGLLPAGYPEKADTEQLRNHFPLVALPQLAGRAGNVLIINSGGGVETRMAADAGIPRIHVMESNRSLKSVAQLHPELHEHLLNNPGITVDYGDIRQALRRDTAGYDQIYLTIPRTKIPGGTEPGIPENYLYTKEAFRDYWARLRPGGQLVVLAGEELTYMKALLVAWEVLDEDRAGGNAVLGQQAWGYRMVTLMPPVRPYQYLLMLAKGPLGDDTAGRVEQEARGMMVEKLFGPGMAPPATAFSIYNRPYYILYHPQGPAVARKALSEYMTWRLKTRVSLNTPTDQHPNFFRFADDMHPALKWLGAACSVLLIGIYLLPLGAERRLDIPANNNRPPLPVFLSQYLALSAGLMMSLVTIASQATLLTERAGYTLSAVFAAALLGATVAVARRQRTNDSQRRWQVAVPAALILCGLSYWILANGLEWAGEWPVFARLVATAVMAFLPGLFATQWLLHALDHLRRNLPVLVPWATAVYGLTAPLAAIAAFWFCQYRGWGTVWAIIAGCYLLALGIGAYLGRPVFFGETKLVSASS